MLPRIQRLHLDQFNAVMEKGRVVHSSLFLVRVLKDQSDIRIAAVTPKKVLKTAVGRNRMRRKIYEAVRVFRPHIIDGTHTIVFAKTTATEIAQKDIVADLKQIFVKAGLLR